MADVFVSYKAEDRRRIQPLVQALQADGYSVWWDEHIGAGDEWRETIERQLDAARCVLVVWSKRSVGPEGRFVRDEASRAQRRSVYVPVLIDAVDPPLGFGESQAKSLRGWKGDHSDPRYQAVLAAVRRVAGEHAQPRIVHKMTHAPVSRRAVVGGGAVGAVAVAGVGGWLLFRPEAAAAADSIAVLPFANLSSDPAQKYFSDGIAEELRSALARLAGLKVVGRTSSEAVRNDDAETAADKLRVANVLTGSVRQSPSTIRVSAELIDGRNGIARWSQNYDRAPGDAIKIQTDIAQNVARELRVALGSAGKAALTIGGTHNPKAQKLLLEAEAVSYGGTRNSLERSINLIDAAIALDSNYAQAYALKALLVLLLVNAYARASNEVARGRAEALRYARKAIGIEPNLPIGHGALAEIYQSNLDIRGAFDEYRRVFELQSGYAEALRNYALFLSRLGKASDALKLANEAVALDPLNAAVYRTRARVLLNSRRYSETIKSLETLKRDSPHLFRAPVTLGNALMMVGRTQDAARSYAEAPADDPFRLIGEAILAIRTGDRAGALQKKSRIEQLYAEAASYQYGQIYAQLGQPGEALTHLERGWEIKDAGLLEMGVDPLLDPIRNQPRFAALMKKMRFPA